jgi:hypothetical protein
MAAARALKRGAPPTPDLAIEEARLIRETVMTANAPPAFGDGTPVAADRTPPSGNGTPPSGDGGGG